MFFTLPTGYKLPYRDLFLVRKNKEAFETIAHQCSPSASSTSAFFEPAPNASTDRDVRMIKLLADHGAVVDARGRDGWTALALAVRSYRNQVVIM